jgi:cytidylate kinase
MGIITISRGSYSRGLDIAQKLSKKLGYECISREILLKASEEFNIPRVELVQAIENAPSVFDRLKHGKKKYVAFIREAFLDHIQNDNIVYHGYAGHYFTQGIPNILKVRIIANVEYRIKVVMKRENVSKDQARKILEEVDSERRKWSMYLYGIDTNSPELYDIVLNVDCLKVDEAVDSLVTLANRPCFQTTHESLRKVKDLLSAARVQSAIMSNFPEAIVKCQNGVCIVSIESALSAENMISKKVEELTKSIDGVKEVKTFIIPFET